MIRFFHAEDADLQAYPSSKPPSSDGLKKQNLNTSLREKSHKKQGAQPGHDGIRMIITGEPDHVTDLIPAPCQKCPQWQKYKGTACNVERRYQVDIVIRQTLEAYDCYKVVCPKTNETLKGIFPDDIKGEIQYGTNITSFIVSLNTVGNFQICNLAFSSGISKYTLKRIRLLNASS